MRIDRAFRIFITLAILLAFVLIMAAVLYLTESFFTVWDRLMAAPPWVVALYAVAVGALVGVTLWLIWRLVVPSRRARLVEAEAVPTEEGLGDRLAAADAAGVDTVAARRELTGLTERRAKGKIYVCMYGEISTGKSALIKALFEDQDAGHDVEVSVRGGSTRDITEYAWRSDGGDELIVADMPGLNEPGQALEGIARDEALRAHIVIYVCDGDLTRDQFATITSLRELDRPLIVVLNKADLLSDEALQAISSRITERLGEIAGGSAGRAPLRIVSVSAGGTERVIRLNLNGTEEEVDRIVPPKVGALRAAIQRIVDTEPALLNKLRDSSVFVLASRKLDRSEAEYRERKAEEIVASSTRRAVVGSLAAVAPGTDILIQGVLGTTMVRELCALYDTPVKDLDTQQFLKLAQNHVARAVPLVLAVAGNALKAFPGLGTVAGGLAHAVAYGLIFDALGSALARTLAAGGGLRPEPTVKLFGETLDENLEARARRIAKLALAARKTGKKQD